MSTLSVGTIKSNTSSPPTIQNSSGTEIGTLCRAWVNFNGVTTVTVRGSFNVSSVTRNAGGDYTINFSTAMPDENYCVSGVSAGGANGSTSISGAGASKDFSFTSSSARIYSVDCSGNANVDAVTICASIFR
jgi:hypothetical protein